MAKEGYLRKADGKKGNLMKTAQKYAKKDLEILLVEKKTNRKRET